MEQLNRIINRRKIKRLDFIESMITRYLNRKNKKMLKFASGRHIRKEALLSKVSKMKEECHKIDDDDIDNLYKRTVQELQH